MLSCWTNCRTGTCIYRIFRLSNNSLRCSNPIIHPLANHSWHLATLSRTWFGAFLGFFPPENDCKYFTPILWHICAVCCLYFFSPCFKIQKQNDLNKRWKHISTALHNHVRSFRVRPSASPNWRRLAKEHLLAFMLPSTLHAVNLQPPAFFPASV